MACVDYKKHPDERQSDLEDTRLRGRGRDRLKVTPQGREYQGVSDLTSSRCQPAKRTTSGKPGQGRDTKKRDQGRGRGRGREKGEEIWNLSLLGRRKAGRVCSVFEISEWREEGGRRIFFRRV